MAKNLYIHVGPAKTGTSAIQAFFAELKTDMLVYPLTGRWIDGSHHSLVFSQRGTKTFSNKTVPDWRSTLESLDEELKCSKNSDVLISSEAATPEFCVALKELSKQHNLQIIIILVFRDHLKRAASSFNQCVKDPGIGLAQHPDDFLFEKRNQFLGKCLIQKWEATGFKVISMSYEGNRSFLERFGDVININVNERISQNRHNQSLSNCSLTTLWITNHLLQHESARRDFFESMLNDEPYCLWGGNSFPFSNTACNYFCEYIEADKAWIKENFNITNKRLSLVKPSLSDLEKSIIIKYLMGHPLINSNEAAIVHLLNYFSLKGEVRRWMTWSSQIDQPS